MGLHDLIPCTVSVAGYLYADWHLIKAALTILKTGMKGELTELHFEAKHGDQKFIYRLDHMELWINIVGDIEKGIGLHVWIPLKSLEKAFDDFPDIKPILCKEVVEGG